jgi:hypothetical protein
MSERGAAIRFVGGKYNGYTGWFNVARAHTKCMYYVIVTMGENGWEKNTRVPKSSVLAFVDERAPVSFEEAVLQQHSDIDVAMTTPSTPQSCESMSKEALLERDWNKSESEKQASLHSLDKSKGKNGR